MSKIYTGDDKVKSFFAHYGRKGMKRGMNIYNPDYKPIGEKAKGSLSSTDPRYSVKKPSLVSTDPRYFVKKPSLSSTDPRYAAPSAKDRERAAMEAASKAGSAATAKRKAEERREKLLASERKRQAEKTADTASKDRSNREAEEKRQYEQRLKAAKNNVNKWKRIYNQLLDLAKKRRTGQDYGFAGSSSPWSNQATLPDFEDIAIAVDSKEQLDYWRQLQKAYEHETRLFDTFSASADKETGPIERALNMWLDSIEEYRKILDEKK